MSNDRNVLPRIWEDKEEEEEALETDYQSLMAWCKKNPNSDHILAYEMLEMITKAKFWVWYLHDQDSDQDKRILDMKGFYSTIFFTTKKMKKTFRDSQLTIQNRR